MVSSNNRSPLSTSEMNYKDDAVSILKVRDGWTALVLHPQSRLSKAVAPHPERKTLLQNISINNINVYVKY